ncbi:MAG TPA: extracellular solute-binding protein [Clostridiales bacterium]|nr:extracellular solute-binding protein [Clostridiales bacterium]
MKRILSIIVALMIVILTFSGCVTKDAGKAEQKTGNTEATQKTEERPKIKMLVDYNIGVANFKADENENKNIIYDWIIENSGFDITFEVKPKDNPDQKVSIIMASGNVPDILEISNKTMYSNFASQGALTDVTELVKTAPNIQSLIPKDSFKAIEIASKIYAVPRPPENEGYGQGIYARLDILKNNGLQNPKTTDEYYNVLKSVTDNEKGVWGITSDGPFIGGFMGAFGIAAKMKEKDGKVVYTYTQPEFKNYLTYIKRLYDEKLLDREFSVNKGSAKEKLISEEAVMAFSDFSVSKLVFENLKSKNSSVELGYLDLPIGPDGSQGVPKSRPVIRWFAIPIQSKNAEAAMKYMDWVCREDVQKVLALGFEGVHYNMVNDIPVPTEKMPDIVWRVIYQRLENGTFPMRIQTKGFWPFYEPTLKNPLVENIAEFVPAIEAVDKKSNELQDYVVENSIKFITGERPLSEFDAFVQEYNKLGAEESMKLINEWYAEFSKK